MKNRLKDYVIVIPLHQPLGHPCDFIDQTALILARNNFVILLDLQDFTPRQSTANNHGKIARFFNNLKTIYSLSKTPLVYNAKDFLDVLQLRFLLWFKKKKVIIWGFDPIMDLIVHKLGETISIYDCIDYLGDDEETSGANETEKKLFEKVDYIAFNSQGLYEKKYLNNRYIKKKSLVTFCGCVYDLFQIKTKVIPDDLKTIKGKKAILAGVFDYRLNIKLLEYIVVKNSDLHFIFIGPFLKNMSGDFFALLKKNNVHYLGKMDKTKLPFYYKNSDVGIIPYDTALKVVKYGNPMKTYEYLASGIPVVSTGIESLKNYPKDILYANDNHKKFNKALLSLIGNWDSKKILRAKKIARENSWENKVRKIENFILSYGKIN